MADVTTDINQTRAMRISQRRVEGFAQQFGEAHRNLARHAAFPLVLTPDLLYQIWANFVPEAPWTAVAHVLLSRLCRQVGYEMYEMDIADRNLLLRELKDEFGQEKFDELGKFLLDYVAQRLTGDDPDTQDLREAQEWTALAYTKPTEVARELAEALFSKVQHQDMAEVVHLASLVKTFAVPLRDAGFEPLLLYADGIKSFAHNDIENATDKLIEILVGEQTKVNNSEVIYRAQLRGQGVASQLSNGTGEFRSIIFKATLRSHALRIFRGLTDEATANRLVETLFGGTWGDALLGTLFKDEWVQKNEELFGMRSRELYLHLNTFDQAYGGLYSEAKEELGWLLTQQLLNINLLPPQEKATLQDLVLHIFSHSTKISKNKTKDDRLLETFFRNVQDKTPEGLLEMSFCNTSLELDTFVSGFKAPTYRVKGKLSCLLTQQLPKTEREAVQKLIKALTNFSMLLGGFGKSWQRVDHRLFFPEYYEIGQPQPLIGCHWEWEGQSLIKDVQVRKLEQVGLFINKVCQTAQEWMQLQGITPNIKQKVTWHEAWHPANVQVWGRLAEDVDDSIAVRWFHEPQYQKTFFTSHRRVSIYKSSLNGLTAQSNRVWHRMYPVVHLVKAPDNPDKPLPRKTRNYLELVTFFPDESLESTEFFNLLSEESRFQKLWPF